MKHAPVFLGTVLLVLATAGFMHWMAPAFDGPSENAAAPAQAQAPAKGLAFFDMSFIAALASPDAPPARWRELQEKMAHAPSLRAFHDDALKRPQDGGYFYARHVLELCSMFPRADAAMSAQRREAADQLQRRCDFAPKEIDDARRKLPGIGEARLSADPLYGPFLAWKMAPTPETTMATLRAAIDVGNPDLIAALAGPSIEVDVLNEMPKFAGSVPGNVLYAQLLTACRLGADCGPGSLSLLSLCAGAGWCGAGLADAVSFPFGADYALIDRLSRQVVSDIRKGQLTRLLRRTIGVVQAAPSSPNEARKASAASSLVLISTCTPPGIAAKKREPRACLRMPVASCAPPASNCA